MALCLKVLAGLSVASGASLRSNAPDDFWGHGIRVRSDGFPAWNDTVSLMGGLGHASAVRRVHARTRHGDLARVRAEFEDMKVKGFPVGDLFPNAGHHLQLGGGAATDPCDADVVVTGFGWPYGFGSRAGLAANEVQLAAVFGLSVAICGDDFAQKTWAGHFRNPAGFAICTPAATCGGGRRDISEAACLGNDLSRELTGRDREYLLKLKHNVYRAMYTYKDTTLAAVNGILEAVPLSTSEPYIGIHIRRGDKRREHDVSLMPMSSYATAALEHMEAQGTRTVFVASDDPGAGDELKDAFTAAGHPDVQVVQQSDNKSDYVVKGSGQREYSDDDSTLALLADMEALRLSTVFVGTQSSNVGRMVFYLRGEMDSCVSVDGDWFQHDWL